MTDAQCIVDKRVFGREDASLQNYANLTLFRKDEHETNNILRSLQMNAAARNKRTVYTPLCAFSYYFFYHSNSLSLSFYNSFSFTFSRVHEARLRC